MSELEIEEYIRILRDGNVTREENRRLLCVHYAMPGRTARYSELAREMGWHGQYDYNKITRNYANWVKRAINNDESLIDAPADRNQHGTGWWTVVGTMPDPRMKNVRMHNNLACALERLGWV